MRGFDEIIERALAVAGEPPLLAVAGSPDAELRAALERARSQGLAGHESFADARAAVAAVRNGEAQILMKGGVDTRSFMQAVLDREQGLRAGRLVSHVAVIEGRGRLYLVTDGGICPQPSLQEKEEIIRNAVPIARCLGMDPVRVAVLAAVEKVNPAMPETVEAEALSRLRIPGCVVQGPLALDNAVSAEAARAKGIAGPVAGRADVLLVPSVLAGNILAKAIIYFAGARCGGVVAGTSRPVCFLSRADSAEIRFNTMALGVLLSRLGVLAPAAGEAPGLEGRASCQSGD